MNFEDIIWSKISQSQRDKYCMIPLTQGAQNSQTQEIEDKSGGFQGLEERNEE